MPNPKRFAIDKIIKVNLLDIKVINATYINLSHENMDFGVAGTDCRL